MKRCLLLIILSVMFTFQGFAQSLVYHHLLDTVNIWHYTYNLCFELPPANNNNNNNARDLPACGDPTWRGIVWTGGDSVYNNMTYKVISVEQNTYWTQQADSCFLGLIREDTLAGKVYYLPNGDTSEMLLYNYGVQIGDTMPLLFIDSVQGYFQNGNYMLDSIDTMTILAGPRRIFYYNCHSCTRSPTISWIEGVGCIGDILYPFSVNAFNNCSYGGSTFPYNSEYFVVCFEHNYKVYFDSATYALAAEYASDPLAWGNHWAVTDSCDYSGGWGGIEQLSSISSFSTYPNPVSDVLTIKLNVAENSGFDIYVKDINGKGVGVHESLGRLNPGLHQAALNMSDLNPGFYLIECRTDVGSLYSKLVVQR